MFFSWIQGDTTRMKDDKCTQLHSMHSVNLGNKSSMMHDHDCHDYNTQFSHFMDMIDKYCPGDAQIREIGTHIFTLCKEHDCSFVVRQLVDGSSTVIDSNGRNDIYHSINVKIIGSTGYYGNEKHKVLIDGTMSIYFCGKLVNAAANELVSHMVQMPLQRYVLNAYDLHVTRDICLLIYSFLLHNEAETKQNEKDEKHDHDEIDHATIVIDCEYNPRLNNSGLWYLNFPPLVKLYDSYKRNDDGQIGLSFLISKPEGEERCYDMYYKSIIQQFNQRILDYIQKNQFYLIKARTAIQILVPKFYCGFGRQSNGSYHFNAFFHGFNNVNRKHVVRSAAVDQISDCNYLTKEDFSKCVVQSIPFSIIWATDAGNKPCINETKDTSFCVKCEFLTNAQGLIDFESFFKFLKRHNDFANNGEATAIYEKIFPKEDKGYKLALLNIQRININRTFTIK